MLYRKEYIWLSIFVFICASAFATQRIVNPGTGAIQAAINASAHGDEIIVNIGTYSENITFGGKNIILRSSDPTSPTIVARTIIDGGGTNSVVRFLGTEASTCVLSGFTIRRGYAYNGGGILGNNCFAAITNNIITWNYAGNDGGGIHGVKGTIENNLVAYNYGTWHAGGIAWCPGTIQNNIICFNRTDYRGGGASDCYGTLVNNVVYGNQAADVGGGFHYVENVRNCIFWNNIAISNPHLNQYTSLTYSCIQGWAGGGTGNINSDPQFVAANLMDFRLKSTSACIDAGTATSGPNTDYYGLARPFDVSGTGANGTGTEFDMGVAEYRPISLAFSEAALNALESASSAVISFGTNVPVLAGTTVDFSVTGGTATRGGVDCALPESDTFWLDSFSQVPAVWNQQSKLLATNGAQSDVFGMAVDIDGDTAVIGAKFDDERGNLAGAAYVFVRSGDTWVQQAKLLGSDIAANDVFGHCVAISGNTIAVGAPYHNSVGAHSGAVYVFTRTGTTWTQQTRITPAGLAGNDEFGWSVALDGNTLLMGAWYDDDMGGDSGSVYVYTRTGNSWSQQAKLLASDGAAWDYFGFSVSLDGNTALINSFGDDQGPYDQGGSAYVFVRNGSTWSQQSKLAASDASSTEHFGMYSVCIKGDTAVIGAEGSDTNGTDAGAAYVYRRTGTTWAQEAKLLAADGAAGDQFGYSVATDGNNLAIGARHDDTTFADTGSVYIFSRKGSTWTQRQKLVHSDAAEQDAIGASVAMDKGIVISGAEWGHNDSGINPGAAYTFDLVPTSIPVTINNDSIDEPDETVIAELQNPTVAALGSPALHTFTILDDEVIPVSFAASNPVEVSESATTLTLTVEAAATPGVATTVAYSIAGGTAEAADVTNGNGILTFEPGVTTQTLSIGIVADSIDEYDQTILVELQALANSTIGPVSSHEVTILDDDDSPVARFAPGCPTQSDESVSTVTLNIELAGNPSEKIIQMDCTFAGGTAGSGDCTMIGLGSLFYSPSETSKQVKFVVNDDSIDEFDETVSVALSNLQNASAGNPTVHTFSIMDDDDSPSLFLQSGDSSQIGESVSTATLIMGLAGNATEKPISFKCALAGGSAGPADYGFTASTIAVASGATTCGIPVAIVDDAIDEYDETVILQIVDPLYASLNTPNVHTLAILDDDAAPSIGFAASASSVAESVSTATLRVQLEGNLTEKPVGVSLHSAVGTAEPSDYSIAAPVALNFDPGTTVQLVDVHINNDSVDEYDETVNFTLAAASNAAILPAGTTHTLTIADDDDAPVIGFSRESMAAGENYGVVSLDVELTGNETEKDLSADYATASGSALTGLDFVSANGTVTLQPPARSKQIDCTIVNDTVEEGPEKFHIDLANPQGVTMGISRCTITIDDDEKPTSAKDWADYR